MKHVVMATTESADPQAGPDHYRHIPDMWEVKSIPGLSEKFDFETGRTNLRLICFSHSRFFILSPTREISSA